MRRRARRNNPAMTAEELVAHAEGIKRALVGSLEVRHHSYRVEIEAVGFDPIDVIRARYWIRRGKPAEYQWRIR